MACQRIEILTSGAAIARRTADRLASWRNTGKPATFGTLCTEVPSGGDAEGRRHAPKFAEANKLCAAMMEVVIPLNLAPGNRNFCVDLSCKAVSEG